MTKTIQAAWLDQNAMAMQSPTSPADAHAELARLGVVAGYDMVVDPQVGKSVIRSEYRSALEQTADDIVSRLESMWDTLVGVLQKIPSSSYCSVSASRVALASIECLYTLCCRKPLADHPAKHELFRVMSSCDASTVPTPVAAELAAMLSKISYFEFMIGRLSYKSQLIDIAFPPKLAAVMDGPYGRLDLPMGDRVVPWRDIEESIEGDSVARKSQHRYKGWQEAYNEPRFRQGFYWRELANSPYLISDARHETPYKYRSYLWSHLG
jgi:hypothetical protein